MNPALLRAWERRYGAVAPCRSETRQRLYSDDDVERLRRIRAATEAGRRVSDVARLDDEQLAVLLGEDTAFHRNVAHSGIAGRLSPDELLERSMERVMDGDERGLRRQLERAVLLYDPLLFLDDVLGVLLERVVVARSDQTIDESHVAAAHLVVRNLLEDLLVRLAHDRPRARLVVTVPRGESREIGAIALAVALSACSCEGLRFDADVPPATIARFAHEQQVDAVALSIAHTCDRRQVEQELVALRRNLDPSVPMIVAGRGSQSMRGVNAPIATTTCTRLQDLPQTVDPLLDRAHTGSGRSEDDDDHSIAS